MSNDINKLREHLFATLEQLRDGTMDLDRAKAVAEVSQVVINSAKVEVDYLRATEQVQGTGFIRIEQQVHGRLPADRIAQLRANDPFNGKKITA
jgi:hypothetical protein